MKFTLHRNFVLASLCGLAVEFKKGEAVYVPPAMHKEAIAIGAVPEEALQDDTVEKKGPNEPTDPAERQAALFAAFEEIVLRGKREDFTASGAPHNKVVTGITGWTLQNKERDAAWTAFQNKSPE